MKQYLAMAAAVVALAACSGSDKKAETAAPTASSAPAAVASAPPATPAMTAEQMADMDKIQAGKWSLTTSMAGQTMPATELCIEKTSTFKEAQEARQQQGVTCSENSYRREGDKLVGHSVCIRKGISGSAPMTVTTDMQITGDLKTAYSMDTTMRIEPAPAGGMGEMKMTVAAKRIGDCDPPK